MRIKNQDETQFLKHIPMQQRFPTKATTWICATGIQTLQLLTVAKLSFHHDG